MRILLIALCFAYLACSTDKPASSMEFVTPSPTPVQESSVVPEPVNKDSFNLLGTPKREHVKKSAKHKKAKKLPVKKASD